LWGTFLKTLLYFDVAFSTTVLRSSVLMIFDSHWIVSDELFTKHALFTLKPYSRFSCGTRDFIS
jgi:hypothetical protein